MNEWTWSIDGMIRAQENWSTERKTCPIVTSSTQICHGPVWDAFISRLTGVWILQYKAAAIFMVLLQLKGLYVLVWG